MFRANNPTWSNQATFEDEQKPRNDQDKEEKAGQAKRLYFVIRWHARYYISQPTSPS